MINERHRCEELPLVENVSRFVSAAGTLISGMIAGIAARGRSEVTGRTDAPPASTQTGDIGHSCAPQCRANWH